MPRRSRLRRLAEAALLIATVLSCSAWTTGDFGRPRSLFGEDEIWPPTILGFPLTPPVGTPATMEPTDEEKLLRNYAYNLLVPPHEGQLWARLPIEVTYGSVLEYDGPPYDYHDYAGRLLSLPVRSPTSRYGRLIDDIRNDLLRMEDFFGTARTVADMDRKREKSLAYISELSAAEVAAVRLRIDSNAFIVGRVRMMLCVRAASYRFALERLVMFAPSPMAVEAERVLLSFERAIAPGCGGAGVAVARPVGPVTK